MICHGIAKQKHCYIFTGYTFLPDSIDGWNASNAATMLNNRCRLFSGFYVLLSFITFYAPYINISCIFNISKGYEVQVKHHPPIDLVDSGQPWKKKKIIFLNFFLNVFTLLLYFEKTINTVSKGELKQAIKQHYTFSISIL